MRLSPELRTALATLADALCTPNPRGGPVHAAARVVGGAVRAAGCAPGEIDDVLARALLPALRAHHPGPEGEWLWARVLASVRAAAAAAPAPAVRSAPRGPAGDAGVCAGEAPVVYRVDADDVITRVNAAWRTAAGEDGVPALADAVVGTSLWDHVAGTTTRRLYAAVHAAVRHSGRAVVLPYRCDAPAECRWMQLVVRPVGRGHLQIVSTVLRRAVRAPVALLDPEAPRDRRRVRVCSLCRRARVFGPAAARGAGRSAWVELDRLAALDPGPAGPAPDVPAAGSRQPLVRHEVCPDCRARVRAALASA
jgi:hypothetical protein